MCFSPTASFVTAGITGTIGLVCLARVRRPNELLLAATPILFAIQQSIEGSLWLVLPSSQTGPAATGLTLLFLLFALVLWPVYAPVTVMLVEPDRDRRGFMLVGLAAGVGVAAYLLWTILTRPHGACILDGHIVYVTEQRHTALVGAAYLLASGLPLLMSSRRAISVFGAIVLVGCVTAYLAYWRGFASVWCFFAAAASVVLLGHFEWARWRQSRRANVLAAG